MTDTSRAIRFREFGTADVLRLERVPVPVPQAGEVVVRTVAAAVNPKDVLVRKGKFARMTGRHFPFGVGHDLAGHVVTVGAGVHDLAPGDRVFAMTGGMTGSSYADHVRVKRIGVAKVPDNVDLQDAAAVPLAALTALQALRDLGRVRTGSRVLINGASGGVGVFAVQIAKLLGAHTIAMCSPSNEALVRELGADEWLDYKAHPIDRQTTAYDVIFDVFGNYHFQKVQRQLAPAGRYITTVPNRRNLFNHILTGRIGGKKGRLVVVKPVAGDLEQLARWLAQGQMTIVIDRVFDLADAAEAHRYIEGRHARGKIVLKTNPEGEAP